MELLVRFHMAKYDGLLGQIILEVENQTKKKVLLLSLKTTGFYS